MKVQRNAPCPCGSGKKYKHCCLIQQSKTPMSQRLLLGRGGAGARCRGGGRFPGCARRRR